MTFFAPLVKDIFSNLEGSSSSALPFDPFGGCMGVKTTSGDEFNIPAYFNEEIEIIEK